MVRFFIVALICFGVHSAADSDPIPWRHLFSETNLAKFHHQYGDDGVTRLRQMQSFLDNELASELDIEARLENINRFFNAFRFVDDQAHWGVKDYWATPLEFVASGGGDCEDFSIAKSFALWVTGVDSERLRLMYAKSVSLQQAHMVLLYVPLPNAMPLVLDNIEPKILPGDKRPDLIPVYSFNGVGLWRAQGFARDERLIEGDSGVRLWRDLVKRMSAQGREEEP